MVSFDLKATQDGSLQGNRLAEISIHSDVSSNGGDHETSPEHYLRQMAAFDEQEYTKEDYEQSSTRLIDRMEDQWNQCWNYLGQKHLRDYATVSIATLYTFFDWLLRQQCGKGGRKRRGTKFASSLGTYWKVFRLVYERATSSKIDGKLNRSMHRVLRKLAKEHGLKKIGRDKACMYVEDHTLVLQTNMTTTKKKYPHGRYRIQAQLYLQLGGFTANRPSAILSLCYRHIQVTLLRDPEGGPHRLLLEFTFEFTKKFLGVKDLNTFPLPEIMYDTSLVFSPHVFLLGLLFFDQAFAARNLTSPEDLDRLQIPEGRNELPLRLRKELDDTPVLRKAVRTSSGWAISPHEPLPYSTLLPWIKKLGQITGFLQVTRPYTLRYAGGKAFNESGNVSEAMQNLMMGHASISTFLNHYLSRRVNVDTQAVVRGLEPQQAVMHAACTMSRSIDPRRPQRLTPTQSASINDHTSVRSLLERRDKLKRSGLQGHEKYRHLNRKINQERQRQRHTLLSQVREQWEFSQPVLDVESQLAGLSTEMEVSMPQLRGDVTPEQMVLIESINAAPGTTIGEELSRRSDAIRAVSVYCGVEEGITYPTRCKRLDHHSQPSSKQRLIVRSDTDLDALEAAKIAVYKNKRPLFCFQCVGNKALPLVNRVKSFSSPSDVSKHFKRKHLKHIKPEEQPVCEICQISLDDRTHLQRHALDAHGTVSE